MSHPDSNLTPYTSVFRAPGSRKIRRNRQALSCAACQKRKSRCDREKPCGACDRRGDPNGCHFGVVSSSSSCSTNHGSAPSSRQSLQDQLSKLEGLMNQLASHPPSVEGPGIDQERLINDSNIVTGKDDGGPSYHGETSWSALVESIRNINDTLHSYHDLEVPEAAISHYPDAVFGDLASITIKDILEALPARQDTDKLVSTYFHSRFLALPILHTKQFQRHYEAFWISPTSTSFLWISILFSILSMGMIVCRFKAIALSSLSSSVTPESFMALSARCLTSGRYLRAGAWSVEAIILHSHCRSFQKQDGDPIIWTLYSVAVRLAQRRGYHRDPSKLPGKKLSPFEEEMRRRVWLAITAYDLLFSFQHGMPPMTHADTCDTGLPSNLEDDDFDEESLVLSPRAPTDPSPILAHITKSQMLPIFRRILHHAIGVRSYDTSTAVELGKELDAWYQSIPPCLKYRPIRDTSFTDASYTIMHRIMLELMFHISRCVLWRSYMLGGASDNFCEEALNTCRESALAMLDMHVDADRAVQPGGRLHEDRYMISSLALHSFLLAAMIICLELTDRPNMEISDRKARIEVLHTAHKLWEMRSSTSEDARHASRVLRAILNKVESPHGASSDSLGSSTMVGTAPESVDSPNNTPAKRTGPSTHIAEPIQDAFPNQMESQLPLDSFYTDAEMLDWASIDKYLRNDPIDAFLFDAPTF